MTTIKNNFKSIIRIAKMELSTMFYSPIAWLMLIIFAFQVGTIFADKLDFCLRSIDMDRGLHALTTIFFVGIGSIFSEVVKTIYLYIPLITMGLLSREYSTGSIKLLYSSPIKNSSIVLGKFLAMVIYSLMLIGIVFIFAGFCGIVIENFDWPLVLTGMLGIFLLLCAYSAIGLFMSSLTSYQVVAAVGTLALLSILNYIKGVGQNIDFIREITYWLSLSGRVDTFTKGMISSEGTIYFVTVITLFILLTIYHINGERENCSLKKKFIQYSLLLIVTVGVGYFSTRAVFKKYYDGTYAKENTLSKESQAIMKKLEGPLKITTYVNLLDRDYYFGVPRNRKNDMSRFEQYLRFKPDIEFEYVYYYDKAYNPNLYAKYPNRTDREIAEKMCEFHDLNFKQFKSPEEIKKIIDLSADENRFIRVIERKDSNGKVVKTYLRNFNDTSIHPKEAEISGALRRLIEKLPIVAFISGHGDRSIKNIGGRGYSLFSSDILVRNSLVNKGFEVIELDLSKNEISEDIEIVVLSDLKSPLSEEELNKFHNYIKRGGNLFILGDAARQENMNAAMKPLNVKFLDGILVQPSQTQLASDIAGVLTKESVEKFPSYNSPRKYNYYVAMPTTVAIDYSEVKDFDVTTIVETASNGCWIENETNDFIENTPTLNPEKGEVEKSYTTIINLSRKINNKEQRIVVSGDADLLCNSEFTMQREYTKSNFTVSNNTFRWLSNDKFPVSTDRNPKIDKVMRMPKNIRFEAKIVATGLLATLILISGVVFIFKRKRK